MNKKSIFEILKWTNVTLELGNNIAKLFGFDPTKKRANTPVESAVNDLHQVLLQGNNQAVGEQIRQKFASATGTDFSKVERFKAYCGLAFCYARNGDKENMDKNIESALSVFRSWILAHNPRPDLMWVESMMQSPIFMHFHVQHDPVATQELDEMLPLLKEIKKYKSQQ